MDENRAAEFTGRVLADSAAAATMDNPFNSLYELTR
jgi:hypothetical protein